MGEGWLYLPGERVMVPARTACPLPNLIKHILQKTDLVRTFLFRFVSESGWSDSIFLPFRRHRFVQNRCVVGYVRRYICVCVCVCPCIWLLYTMYVYISSWLWICIVLNTGGGGSLIWYFVDNAVRPLAFALVLKSSIFFFFYNLSVNLCSHKTLPH